MYRTHEDMVTIMQLRQYNSMQIGLFSKKGSYLCNTFCGPNIMVSLVVIFEMGYVKIKWYLHENINIITGKNEFKLA